MSQNQVQQVLSIAATFFRPFDWKDIAIRVTGNRKEIMECLSVLKTRGHLACSEADATTRTYTITDDGRAALN